MIDQISTAVRELKYRPEAEIEQGLRAFISRAAFGDDKATQLKSFIQQKALDCPQEGEDAIFVVLLSFILSDVAGQMDPQLREANAKKIEAICNARDINYQLVRHLTTYEQSLASILKSDTDSDL